MNDTPITTQAQQLWDQGNRLQALDLLEDMAARMQEKHEAEEAFALFQMAYNFAIDDGDLQRAIAFLMQLIDMMRTAGDEETLLEFLDQLAMVQKRAGDFVRARETLEQAIHYASQLPDARILVIPLWIDMGFVERDLGHFNKAREYMLLALTALEESGEQPMELARTFIELAILEKDQQHFASAQGYIDRTLVVLRHQNAPREYASALVVQALIVLLQNNPSRALRLYNKALKSYRQADDRENEALVLHNMGLIYDDFISSKGSLKKALECYAQSLEINKEIGAAQGVADNLVSIAGLFQLEGNLNVARQMYKEALQVYEQAQFLEGEIDVLTNLGIIEREEQHFDAAKQYLDIVIQKALEMDSLHLIADGYRNRADIALAAERVQEAIDDYIRVVEVTESIRALLQEEEALGYFNESRLKAYSNLVRLLIHMPDGNARAYFYMEQVKSREFLRRLRMSDLPHPEGIPEALLKQEAALLAQLRKYAAALADPYTTDRYVVVRNYQEAEKQIYNVWGEMEKYDPEYKDLRSGKPVSWQELKALLQPTNR